MAMRFVLVGIFVLVIFLLIAMLMSGYLKAETLERIFYIKGIIGW